MSDQIPEVSQGIDPTPPPSAEEFVPDSSNTEESGNENLDFGGNQEQEQFTRENGEESDPTGDNPAWTPVLENIPDEFHRYIKPHLSKQDQYIQKVQSQYAPYKPLIENNIPIENIQRSIQLAAALNADPRRVWEELGRRFNFSDQGHEEQNSEKPGQENDEEQEETDPNALNYDPLKDPRMQPYLQQQQAIAEFFEQQQEAERNRQWEAEMAKEWETIEKQHGQPLSQDDKIEIMQRTANLMDVRSQQAGRDVDVPLSEGYKDYMNFVNRIRGSRANNSAPDVLAGRGGLPTQPGGIGAAKTSEERQDYIVRQMERLGRSEN